MLTIPARFNGPPGSANGGYAAGLVAGLVGSEVASVSLRAPPPLERPLAVVRDNGGVELRDGDTLVAEGNPDELLLDVPDPVSPADAAAASEAGREHWCAVHPFPTCVVCGPKRASGDGLRVFPGELRDGVFAADWTPDESIGDGSGFVAPGVRVGGPRLSDQRSGRELRRWPGDGARPPDRATGLSGACG